MSVVGAPSALPSLSAPGAENGAPGTRRWCGTGTSICPRPRTRGYHRPGLSPPVPGPRVAVPGRCGRGDCPPSVRDLVRTTRPSPLQRSQNWSCPGPGPSQYRSVHTPHPMSSTESAPKSPTKAATRKLTHPGRGVPSPAFTPPPPPRRAGPTCTLRAARGTRPSGVGSSPRALGKALCVLLASQNEPLSLEGLIPCCRLLAERALGEAWGRGSLERSWERESGMRSRAGLGRPEHRGDTVLSPETAGRLGGGEGGCRPSRTSAIPYSPGWAASAGWGEGRRGTSAGTKGHCAFFFFFFFSLSRIQLPIPASCGWRTWWNF